MFGLTLEHNYHTVVNEGPMKICEIFLTKPDQFHPVHVDKLKECLRTFVKLCGFAIALNKSLIGPQRIHPPSQPNSYRPSAYIEILTVLQISNFSRWWSNITKVPLLLPPFQL